MRLKKIWRLGNRKNIRKQDVDKKKDGDQKMT